MKTLRAIAIRISALLVTLLFALTVSLGLHVYRNRQAIFTEAAFRGNFFRMNVLYHLGVNVNAGVCPYPRCVTPLWGAAYAGHDGEIRFLLERGADVNSGDALMAAAIKGHESTVRLLLSRGATVNSGPDAEALIYVRNKYPEVSALLEQSGRKDAP